MEGQERHLRDFLLESGLLSRSQLDAALKGKKPLSRALIESGILSEEEVRRAAAHALGIPYVILERDMIDPQALSLIPEPLCRQAGVVAYRRREESIEVALLDMAALDELEFLAQQYRIVPRLTSQDSLRKALLMYQKILKEHYGAKLESARSGEEAFESLVLHALSQHAEDLYIEPENAAVRYRIEGVVRPAMQLSKRTAQKIIDHLVQLGKKDARFTLSLPERVINLRSMLLPTAAGERLSLHISPHGSRKGFTLESLGLGAQALEAVHQALRQKKGLITVAGPQGSGVTTTLYTLLDVLNRPSHSLMSVEREIEYHLPQVAQTQLQGELGLSALAALRGALRQDPDILMLNDIEDDAALSLAQEASKRCLVLVGRKEAPSEGQGLMIMQRLVRRLCPHYREERVLSRAEAAHFEGRADFGKVFTALKEGGGMAPAWKDTLFYRAEACGECEGGYRGTIGLFEVHHAGEVCGLTLAEDGLFKAAMGHTTIEEVVRQLAG